MAGSTKDKVVILGMGCSRFGERWDMETAGLALEADRECLEDAGIGTSDIDAAWYATALEEYHAGKSSIPLATALRLPYLPGDAGRKSLRQRHRSIPRRGLRRGLGGGGDRVGDRRGKTQRGFGGLPQRARGATNALYFANSSAPGSFAQLASAYEARRRIAARRAYEEAEIKDPVQDLCWKFATASRLPGSSPLRISSWPSREQLGATCLMAPSMRTGGFRAKSTEG